MILASCHNTMRNAMRNAIPVSEPQYLRMVQSSTGPRHPFRRAKLIDLSRRYNEAVAAKRRRDIAVNEMLARVVARYECIEPVGPRQNVSHPQSIIATIETFCGLEPGSIVSASRSRQLVPARYDAIVAVFENCEIQGRTYSLPELGRVFNRDHTVCLYALRQRGVK